MKKEWIKIISKMVDNLDDISQIKCPNCGECKLDYRYIGDEKTRIGFLQMWCNKCLKGIYISRVVAPKKAKFLSFDDELEGIIPNYDFIED